MNNIKILDCTLRDGGYVNNWEFPFDIVKEVISAVYDAGVRIIEVGLMASGNTSHGTKFTCLEDVESVLASKNADCRYAVMATVNEISNLIVPASKYSSIDIFRIAFFKEDMADSLKISSKMIENGYEVTELVERNSDAFLILIEIGAYGFRNLIAKHPNQIKNIGIFEPGTISVAAGMALTGVTPTIYGISPFVVQRSLEQLKLDFIYQNLSGNFITTGASYDFSTLGYSHYCPEDVMTLKTLPGFEIVTPATPSQFSTLFSHCSENGNCTYYRMTDHCCQTDVQVEFGKASVIKQGNDGVVVVFAEILDAVVEACSDLDMTILYYSTASPFDYDSLRHYGTGSKLVICHPFYEGTFSDDIQKAFGRTMDICEIAVPKQVLRNYGTKEDKDQYLGLTASAIRQRIELFI